MQSNGNIRTAHHIAGHMPHSSSDKPPSVKTRSGRSLRTSAGKLELRLQIRLRVTDSNPEISCDWDDRLNDLQRVTKTDSDSAAGLAAIQNILAQPRQKEVVAPLRGLQRFISLTLAGEKELLEAMRSTEDLTIISGGYGFFSKIEPFLAMLRERFVNNKSTCLITDDPKIRKGAHRDELLRRIINNTISKDWPKHAENPDLFSIVATKRSPLPYVAVLMDTELWLKQLFLENSPSLFFAVYSRDGSFSEASGEIESDIHQARLEGKIHRDWNIISRYKARKQTRRSK